MTSTPISIPTLNPALRNFWTTQARNKVLYGGRSSSKSWDAAGFAIF
ncbi:PBSX family phage terminase large subunit, partial [Salmonella enterica]|nr:PBSX family phage terminase large subunit [Salmonella enterica]